MSAAARAAAGAACNRAARGQLVSHGVSQALAQMQRDMDDIANLGNAYVRIERDAIAPELWRSKEAA